MDIGGYISGVVSRLGFFDDNVYKPDPDCYCSITELIRSLREDDGNFTVRRTILSQNTLKNDLLKILLLSDISEKLFDATLRLTVNLMTPAFTLADIKHYDDTTILLKYLREIDNSIFNSLTAFADEDLFKAISRNVVAISSKSNDDIMEEENIKMERYYRFVQLIFYNDSNILPNFAVEKRDRKIVDNVVIAYIKSGLHKELVDFALSQKQNEFIIPIFCITTLIIHRYDPYYVATAVDTSVSKNKLSKVEEQVLSKMIVSNRPQRPPGRSFLGGTYTVNGMKALNSDRSFVVLKPIENRDIMTNFNDRKGAKAIAKNRRITNNDQNDMFDVPNYILYEIKKYVMEMMDGSFRKLIKNILDKVFDSTRHGLNQFNDRFFFVLNSFLFKFCKAAKINDFQKVVYFNKEFVHIVLTRIEYYFDSMKMEKERLKQHLKGAECAIGCFESMVVFLKFIGDDLHESNEDFYKDIITYLFEMQESREMTGNIMHSLGPTQISMPMLHSLILLNEYYMFMMEKENKRGRLTHIKTKRKRKAQPKLVKKKDRDDTMKRLEKDSAAYSKKYTIEELDEIWEKVSTDLEDIIDGVIEPDDQDIHIIDFALDIDDPKVRQLFAILKVRRALRESKAAEAIAYYKSGQAFWFNEGDAFADELKMSTLKDIMYLEDVNEAIKQFKSAVKELTSEKPEENNENEFEGEGDGEKTNENFEATDFNLISFISKLANYKVLNWYFVVFQNYQVNPEHVNMAILKFFQRIWRELEDPVRLYDIRLFFTFDDIANTCKKMTQEQIKLKKFNLLYTFAEKFTTEFFEHFKNKGSILINDLWT